MISFLKINELYNIFITLNNLIKSNMILYCNKKIFEKNKILTSHDNFFVKNNLKHILKKHYL